MDNNINISIQFNETEETTREEVLTMYLNAVLNVLEENPRGFSDLNLEDDLGTLKLEWKRGEVNE